MRKISNLMSPVSWLVVLLLLAPSWLLLFYPSWRDILILFAVDTLAFLPIIWLDRRLIARFSPKARLFYDGLKWEELEKLTGDARDEFLRTLRDFPGLRMRLFLVMGSIKAIPAALIVLLFWEPVHGTFLHGVTVLCVFAVIQIYGAGCVFIDCSLMIAQHLDAIRGRLGWDRAFARERFVRPAADLERVEAYVTAVLLGFYMMAMLIVFWDGLSQRVDNAPETITFLVVACFIIVMRLQQMARRYRNQFMASAARRLEEKEHELSLWVLDHAERQRFRAFGEVAGLVVHDLANPIHTVAFCAEALKENPQSAKRDNYLEIILKNCDKVSSLIKSLRTYLKRGNADRNARLLAVHQSAMEILGVQYATKNFQKVKVDWDPSLDEVRVNIASNEIIHVLLNLYSNAVKDFLDHKNIEPRIRTALCHREKGYVTFEVADNGSGLSPEGFHTLVSSGFIVTPLGRKDGLGLRLGCRLLEQHGGSVQLDEEYFKEGRGTRLLLKLPEIAVGKS